MAKKKSKPKTSATCCVVPRKPSKREIRTAQTKALKAVVPLSGFCFVSEAIVTQFSEECVNEYMGWLELALLKNEMLNTLLTMQPQIDRARASWDACEGNGPVA